MSDDSPQEPTKYDKAPESELGQLAARMLEVCDDHEDVRAIVMLHRGNQGMTALGGYEDDDNIDAAMDLFQYLQKLMEANGRTMEILAVPDHPPTS